jgi:two-component system nitrogen regulation response regulator GlnG
LSKILVIDDEPGVCFAFEKFLRAEGHSPVICASAEDALARIPREKPDLIITDLRLPGMSGMDLLEQINRDGSDIPVIMITAHGTMKAAVEAMRLGAYEYLVKPIDLDEAKIHIDRALESTRKNREIEKLQQELAGLYGAANAPGRSPAAEPPGIIGRTAAMQEVYKKIGAVSMSDATVIITGESGTGKELVARAIHFNSARRGGPFEPINCASLPETLLESELYGHEKGSFTGAIRQKRGKFEAANGGTVFLDEVGDIPPGIQVKLLRFLEDRKFTRVGGTEHLSADVRIVAATNQNLEEKIKNGTFREDLYYRLSVVAINLPPLRERREDLPLLTAHFLSRYEGQEITQEALEMLKRHQWPGNVRELRNAVEHAVVLSRGKAIAPEHLPEHIAKSRGVESPLEEANLQAQINELSASAFARRFGRPDAEGQLYEGMMEMWERPLIERALKECGGNQVRVAALLGIHRTTLRKKIRHYGIS